MASTTGGDGGGDGVIMGIMAAGDKAMLCRPCVDCGVKTSGFCDFCYAKDRLPNEKWADKQRTPLCIPCDRDYDKCRFCRAPPKTIEGTAASLLWLRLVGLGGLALGLARCLAGGFVAPWLSRPT